LSSGRWTGCGRGSWFGRSRFSGGRGRCWTLSSGWGRSSTLRSSWGRGSTFSSLGDGWTTISGFFPRWLLFGSWSGLTSGIAFGICVVTRVVSLLLKGIVPARLMGPSRTLARRSGHLSVNVRSVGVYLPSRRSWSTLVCRGGILISFNVYSIVSNYPNTWSWGLTSRLLFEFQKCIPELEGKIPLIQYSIRKSNFDPPSPFISFGSIRIVEETLFVSDSTTCSLGTPVDLTVVWMLVSVWVLISLIIVPVTCIAQNIGYERAIWSINKSFPVSVRGKDEPVFPFLL
jgi:hypothetical protein